MNFKKILMSTLVIVMMLTCFAGCAINKSKDKTPNVTAENQYDGKATLQPNYSTEESNTSTQKPVTNDTKTDFTVTVGTVTGKPGDTVYVPIEVKSNPGVCAFYITMNYSEKLDLISHKDGGVLSAPLHGGNLDANPYNLTWDDSLEENSNNGVITTLEFVISKDAKAGETLEISVKPMFGGVGAIFDYDLVDLPINCVAGGVTVE